MLTTLSGARKNNNFSKIGKQISRGKIEELEQIRANYGSTQVSAALDKLIEDGDDSVIKTPDIGKNSIEIVMEELQMNPEDRQYVNRCLPRYKLDPAWIEAPCYYGDEGQRFDFQHICKHYVYTMFENPKLGVADKGTMEYRFDCFMQMNKKRYCDSIKEKIKYDPKFEPQANKFLEQIYNIYKPSFVEVNGVQYYCGELFKAVIKHFIWSIKWKMNKGEKCLNNLFVNFEGEQGCGKSQFAEHIGKAILGNYYTNGDINLLGDQFGAAILEDKFLINFDELVKNDVPIEKIKQITTAELTEYRKMMTEKYITHYIRASFMSTCNKPIYEVINDETGSRRFANFKFMNGSIKDEIELCSKLDKLWDENVVALWKSVDENLPNGYVVGNDMGVLLDRARTTYNAKSDTVRKWLNAQNKCIVSTFKNGSQKLEIAYNEYKEYCNLEDVTPCSLENFKTRIKHMYTGKVKLPPNKLAISTIAEATLDSQVDEVEVNPFSEYLEFKPYVVDDITNIPLIPCEKASLEANEKNVEKTENQGGISGISGINTNTSGNLLENGNFDTKNIPPTINDGWNKGGIIDDDPDFDQDNEDFFNKLKEQEN